MSLKQRAKDLRGERLQLVAQGRKYVEQAEAEKRPMNTEERSAWKKIMARVDELKEQADDLDRQARADETRGKRKGKRDDEEDDKEKEDDEERDDEDKDEDEDEERDGEEDEEDEEDEGDRGRKLVVINGRRYVLAGKGRRRNKPGDYRMPRGRQPWESEAEHATRMRRSRPEYQRVFWEYMARGETALHTSLAKRAIQADSDIVGGYLVAPQEFVGQLIKFVDNFLWIRRFATKYTVKAAQSLGAPSLDVDLSDSDWTGELDTGNEDTVMAFGKRELTPHPLAKRLRMSNRLLRMASISAVNSAYTSPGAAMNGPEGLVRNRLGYKFGVTEEKAFMLGTGSNQPLGIFTASSRGIDTSRDVLTGAATGFTGDGLIAAKYNQKVQYWPRLRWVFHRNALEIIRKLKDGNGQYLWVPGGFGGEDDSLLQMPVSMSEYAPNTFTSGQYVGILGDFSFYWIVDSQQLEIQRLVELYAAANQTGFIARMELDGMPVLAEAFTRLKTN